MIIPDDERNKFISLHEALTLIARQRKLDPLTRSGMQEAARTLALNLKKEPLFKKIDWLFYDSLYGTRHLSAGERIVLESILEKLAIEGKTDDIPF